MVGTSMWKCLQLLVVLNSVVTIKCEYFSSLGHMEGLLNTDKDLISSLRQYIKAEEDKLDRVKKVADELQKDSDNARNDVDGYLGHPINQYRLLRGIESRWSDVENLVLEKVSRVFRAYLSSKREHFPGDEDTKGVAQAIMRLQDTYKLDTHDIAQGIIKGSRANKTLSAEDCFHIGMTAYLENDYYHSTLWMNEALLKDDFTSLSKFDVLDYLTYSVAQQGNIRKAYEFTSEMLKIDPNHRQANKNYRRYRKQLKKHNQSHRYDDDKIPFTKKLTRQINDDDSHVSQEHYESLCRRENSTTPRKIEKRLRCRYWTNGNHPRLILQPAKVEELWHSPHVVRFHDIISDKEIAEIKAIAKPRLRRATVDNSYTGKEEQASYRISKNTWLSDSESPTVEKVSRRISDVTGLSMESAESLQIANYGVGGQYDPHYDHATEDEDAEYFYDEDRNRIATMLAYMSDVEHGGSTVFPKAGVAVQPIKGSAVFWYNLLASGEGDARTLHAACPVLSGVKWVANKWIHERGQEFRRPCGLKKNSNNRIF